MGEITEITKGVQVVSEEGSTIHEDSLLRAIGHTISRRDFLVRTTGAVGVIAIAKYLAAASGRLAAAQSFDCVSPQNLIQFENCRPGTDSWVLANPATDREIEGYASLTSVNIGGQIDLYVNVKSPATDPQYDLEIFRMGYYGGPGGRSIRGPITRDSIAQPMPEMDPQFATFDCNWTDPYQLTIPTDWVSGVCLVKLTARISGKQSYIIFVVRDDNRESDFLFQSSVTTYQAYNNWPGSPNGKSLYGWSSSGNGPSIKASFNRPYAITALPNTEEGVMQGPNLDARFGVGAGEFLTTLNHKDFTTMRGQEYNMVRFLEKEGYDVTYATNIDTHQSSALLKRHRGFFSVGHDEYWTMEMRDNVEAARDNVEATRDNGVNLAFFSANTAYWQIRLEPSRGIADRIVVEYRGGNDYSDIPMPDPNQHDPDPIKRKKTTVLFRDLIVGRPEDELLGVRFECVTRASHTRPFWADVVIEKDSTWVTVDTGLQTGSRLSGLAGYEVDQMCSNPCQIREGETLDCGTPPGGLTLIARSPLPDWPGRTSDMTVYTAESGAIVFAAGTIQWSWGLDDYNADAFVPRVPPLSNTAAQKITHNVLERFRSYDRVDVFARGLDNAMWHKGLQGGRWGDWHSLGGGFRSGPATSSWGVNRLHVFALGLDLQVFYSYWDGVRWSDWQPLGAPSVGLASDFDPAAVSRGPGRIDLFARGNDRAIWHKKFDGGVWQAWQSLGGGFNSGPATASRDVNRLYVFALGLDNALWNNFWDGTAWSDWQRLGTPPTGELTSHPAAVSWDSNRIDVFIRGRDNASNTVIWRKVFDGVWQGWEAIEIPAVGLPADLSSGPAVSSYAKNRLDLFVKGADKALWRRKWDGSDWQEEWESLGGGFESDSAAVSWYGRR
jgi:N,N-dimethylformamidase beta subunit-like, C-terminal